MNNYLLKYGKAYFQKILKKKISEAIANEGKEKEEKPTSKVVILD